MKFKHFISILFLGFIGSTTWAQNNAELGIGFSSWNKNEQKDINEANNRALQVKIEQIIARNGAGSISAMSQLFVIYPEFVITRTDVVESGIKPISVVRADLTLFAVNKADMSNYGSTVVNLQGNGNNEQEAIRSMITRIQPTNSQFARFINNAREKVVEYYASQTPVILAKVKSLVDRQQYNDALALLSMIPECVDNYPDIADQMSAIYLKVQNNVANSLIQKANAKLATTNYDEALKILVEVDPTSPQFQKAEQMIEQIKQNLNEKELEQKDIQLKIYEDNKEAAARARDNDVELKKLQIEASKKTANRELSSQIKKAESSGGSGLKDWFFGKLK